MRNAVSIPVLLFINTHDSHVSSPDFGLPPDIVGSTLNGLGVEEVFRLESLIPDNVALGTEDCLKRCGITRPTTPATTQRQPRVAGNAYPSGIAAAPIPTPTFLGSVSAAASATPSAPAASSD